MPAWVGMRSKSSSGEGFCREYVRRKSGEEMSNVAQSVGNALIDEALIFGIELYVNPEGNQVLTRNKNSDPSRQIRPGLMNEVSNNRGSILIALMAKQGIKSEA